ncbi:rhodanese-related sulfurtransferase [Ponticoccus sp. SC2-23]|uniref:oxygen-dependent tRNA uridine(34) hydroxylase TrhO n=1 Tax=Alexandriicola marinus TaxID=2081710 RepID=UPI000FDBF7F2|nr:rhodanese-related sulfurtransferase [Alexandriicola marinus]MBM1221775.1 rhodanese-related sulfurtransferase [Ponticoccus sp. SC6-9]MBM1226126.1 rhodanese-related sulfurtransferase [Ponticoccus sp. SC6-15]MBM1230722.1 rhodanese-related sulfurtransferase [Ponticoccus sp. SC6-38]MBM1235437.1 rhodanese-related sulfurtransferase [Ponticoccus sp. SC6-45]MBM1239744.1 rhodanese-related sulfurtransferase [Ponticoccus sp. SC6-49]MBM1243888.1 rhodanese-related sulfurtransferase [Ponticoccus sp. SC2-
MFKVSAFYHFTPIGDPAAIRQKIEAAARARQILGTILVATEGLNGTIAGEEDSIDGMMAWLAALPGCDGLDWKTSHASERPFGRLRVRLKKEIVTMGVPTVDPRAGTGHYVDSADWNDLISDPDVAVIDTRNDYEVEIGTFRGAIDPQTSSFGEFPEWWDRNADTFRGKKIAMFCTGGIRCEKSTNFLLSKGVEEVYHLKGGILKYLEEVPEERSLWNGECFVFDGRVSVGHGLREGEHMLCHACRRPLRPEDRDRNTFEEGVSCHRCHDETTEADKARFRERQRQIVLARTRGEEHLGRSVPAGQDKASSA